MRNRDASEIVGSELETDPRRIQQFTAALDMIGKMEGKQLDKKERLAAATIGGAMSPYDSAFDKYDIRTAKNNGQSMIQVIDGTGKGESLEPTVRRALQLAQENLNPSAITALKDLTLAQIDSVRQREAGIEVPFLEDVTRRKGANTALLFALEVNPDLSAKKRKCYEELGFLIQLVDDFQDVEKDKADGIATLATVSNDKTSLSKQIQNQYQKVNRLFAQNYEAYQLVDFSKYLDKLVAGIKAGQN